MSHRSETPDNQRKRIPNTRSQPVDDRPAKQQPDRIGDLKAGDNVAVLLLVPANLIAQRRRQNPNHLAVKIVDCRREK
jgi:hypothetical protein